jgi:hypothetical protein
MAIQKGDAAALEALGKMDDLSKAVTATGIGIGGAVTPAAARQYFTTVTDASSFLGRVSSTQVDALEQDVDLFHIAPRSITRVAEGTEPGTTVGASNLGKRWALKDVQLFPTVNFSAIVNRQKQGNIETYLANLFATVFRNDLLLLGLEGDEALTGDDFKKLNDGWVALAQDAVATTDRDMDNVLDTTVLDHMATMDAMIQEMDDKYLIEGQTCFLMSRKNAISWGKEMGDHQGLNPYLITGQVPQYQGFEVIGIPGMPADTFMLTNPANLAFGMGHQIQRFREVRPRKRCVEYTWTLYADYLIVNDEAVVYSDPA